MATQLVQPNFNVTEIAGWCLRFSDKVFGLKAAYPTAWSAWQATKSKHQDRSFPDGVAVPVWFDWWGDVGSGRQQYGHVAVRAADGKIWSSPLSGTGRAWFASVDDLVRAFGNGMKYVGWSEDISNVKVIEIGEEMIQDTEHEYVRWANLSKFVRGRANEKRELVPLTRDEFRKSAVGKTWLTAIEIMMDDPEANLALSALNLGVLAREDQWEKQIADLQSAKLTDAEKRLQSIKDALGIN